MTFYSEPTTQAEYVYMLDAVPEGFTHNGLVEVQAVNDTHLLVMERAWNLEGERRFLVKLYIFSVTGATDVLGEILQVRPWFTVRSSMIDLR